ncbi:MAG TPA: hypothetical protein VEL05_10820, partial [Candidatus Acidoferrum sp.]|nr:hypothetical protein [Candidatus Acidoferrum sp.]
ELRKRNLAPIPTTARASAEPLPSSSAGEIAAFAIGCLRGSASECERIGAAAGEASQERD